MSGDLFSKPGRPADDDDAALVGHQSFGGSMRDLR